MSKAVMISIQPKWCQLIASGKKTIEVRKTRPKIATPFKCYIYCTYGEGLMEYKDEVLPNVLIGCRVSANKIYGNCCNGKVIGEFICDGISEYECEFHNGICLYYEEISKAFIDEDGCEYRRIETANDNDNPDNCYLLRNAAMTFQQIKDYANWDGFGMLYGWHISNLVIYDEPKELSEFYVYCDRCDEKPIKCKYAYEESSENGYYSECMCDFKRPIERPPQSWCYVEEASE